MKHVMHDVRNYNAIEFYYEREGLLKILNEIKTEMKKFNLYMPKYALGIGDFDLAAS